MAALFPTKIYICSIVSLIYSIFILMLEPMNVMGIYMYCLFVFSLYSLGFFNCRQKLKNILSGTVLFVLVFSEIRFGLDVFKIAFAEKLAHSFVLFLLLFFVQAYVADLFEVLDSKKRLDIQKYQNLKRRDAEWLQGLLRKV